MAKNKRMITIRAGRMLVAVCYTQVASGDPDHVRKAKERATTEARKRINHRYSWQKCELLLAANFKSGDLFLTLTYDDDHLPENRKAAMANIQRYIRLLRQIWRKNGTELKYIYCTEDTPDEKGGEKRLHHHIVINNAGCDYETVTSLWTGGQNVEASTLDDFGGYTALAQYLSKDGRGGHLPVGARSWSPSRNLSKPTRESQMVDECVTIVPPAGCTILEQDSNTNGWGQFAYLKCLLPEPPKSRRKRPKKE